MITPGGVRASVAVLGDTEIEVTLVLRRRVELPDLAGAAPIPAAEFAVEYGADPADVALVTATVTALGARVVSVRTAARLVRVAGLAAVLSRMFGTSLRLVTGRDTAGAEVTYRVPTSGLSVPAVLDGVVTAVLGLDNRPQAHPQFRPADPATVSTSYTPLQLGRIYRFPEGTDGAGHTIAIIELGGGFTQVDLDTYFGGLGIGGPVVSAVGVDGGANTPEGDPRGADGEVLLDLEVAGALAPAAAIVVYFAPNTDAGFVDAVAFAAHATLTPTALSISWGMNEDAWSPQARTALDEALADAAALGVTVTVAAGDKGSTDGASDGRFHVDFPASSPHVLACGGTRLDANPTTAEVVTETVWNNGVGAGATGGGVSDVFGRPSWQASAGVPMRRGRPGRGVPDVAAVADPQTGYRVWVDATDLVLGGTSAVAPLWAALVTRLAQAVGRPLGLMQPALYESVAAGTEAPGFRDITAGSNGAYSAGPGWDPCTGLGVPHGTRLLAALRQHLIPADL
ncbi:MAG: peptidase S53 [Pseudonocardiales bacterium]|nr:peptidase S53 [Pseudonocardiales bacterium]MBV9031716.1 peptidase S53 [Pseudonocardiales bacterium]